MRDQIQLGLDGAATPEYIAVALDAYDVLVSIGSLAFEDELQQIIGLQDGISDNTLLVSRINDVLIYTVGDALHKHRITVTEDTDLPLMIDILRSVSLIEAYIIPETIADLTTTDLSDEEILAEIVPLFTARDSTEVLDHLTEVHPDVIQRIYEVTEMQHHYTPDAESSVPQDMDERLYQINQLRHRLGFDQLTLAHELACQGVRPGLTLGQLFELTLDKLDALMTPLVAGELLGLLLYSNYPIDDVAEAFEKAVAEYTDEYQEQVRIIESFTNQYVRFLA